MIRCKLCCTDLSLRCDPDRHSAIVPPLIDMLGLIVRLLHARGRVEPHVVDYPVVLHIAACERRIAVSRLALIIHGVTRSH